MTTHAAAITPTQTQPPPGATIDPDNVWVPVKQLPEHCPGESEGGARWAIFNENFNGLAQSGAVVRRGRKVLVNPKRWIAWTRTNPTLSPPRPKAGQKVTPKAGRLPTPPRAVPVLDHEAACGITMDTSNGTPGEARTGTHAQNESARPLGKGTGRKGNVLGDACHSTAPDPLAGWLELGKPSRTKRQGKRQWARGRR